MDDSATNLSSNGPSGDIDDHMLFRRNESSDDDDIDYDPITDEDDTEFFETEEAELEEEEDDSELEFQGRLPSVRIPAHIC